MTDNATKNREHWDQAAKTYDSKPWQQQLINQITEDLRARHQWLGLKDLSPSEQSEKDEGVSVKLLDYACGPGTITRALAPYITSSVGMDVAPGMVEEYNRRASAINDSQYHAILGDLCNPDAVAEDLMSKDLFNFDIAAVGMGFHHFEHLQRSLDRLVERLRPGGVLFIVDLIDRTGDDAIGAHATDDFVKEAARTVPHKHGFTREHMQALFEGAGCEEFGWEEFEKPAVMGEGEGTWSKKIFVAKGTKA